MTPKSFITILLKFFGIYLIIEFIPLIARLIISIYLVNWNEFETMPSTAFDVFNTLIMIGIYLFVFYMCLFKTQYIIDKLYLDKDFEEEKFELNIHRSTLLSIATIIIGGFLFIDALPGMCRTIVSCFQQKRSLTISDDPVVASIIYNFIRLFIGYFMMSNNRIIVNYIERKRKK